MNKYTAASKYQLMYRVLKMGNLLHAMLPNLKTKNSVGVLDECSPDDTQVKLLNNSQQFAVFYLARDISADFFHFHYERKVEDFVNHCLSMTRGTCNPLFLVKIYREGNDAVRGTGPRGTKKYLSDAVKGRARINKLFCQAGYFILKAGSFLKDNDFESACMALVGAGNCGKDFNRSTLNPVKEGSVMEDLYIIRNRLSHVLEQEYNEAEILKWVNELDLPAYLDRLGREAEQMGNPVNIRDYYEGKEDSDDEQQSPRAYDATRFDH
ncbi:MAG: hypothetical protein SFW07_03520 [Gammaproteobacteria bacterium]|nr:hypothetical protein [Gammaproteobacteria bacterium]